MTATIQMPQSVKKPQNVQKEDAMWQQKELINRNYRELATAREQGRKVSATFVPGNLNELLMCFDFARSLPETNALQNGMRKKSGKMIMDEALFIPLYNLADIYGVARNVVWKKRPDEKVLGWEMKIK